jgi:SAM-dependent methyltransferase
MHIDKSQMAADVFDKRATEYQNKYMDTSLYHDSFNLFCDYITKENPDVLELACGPGNISQYLLQRRPDFQLYGTDLAPNMVELARINNPGATFEVMDCRDLVYLKRKFDGLMCGFCLPYLSKDEATELIYDAGMSLRTDGILYISTMEGDYKKKSGYQTSSYGDQVFVHYHQSSYLKQALRENNFKLINMQRQDFPMPNGPKTTDLVLIARKKEDLYG